MAIYWIHHISFHIALDCNEPAVHILHQHKDIQVTNPHNCSGLIEYDGGSAVTEDLNKIVSDPEGFTHDFFFDASYLTFEEGLMQVHDFIDAQLDRQLKFYQQQLKKLDVIRLNVPTIGYR